MWYATYEILVLFFDLEKSAELFSEPMLSSVLFRFNFEMAANVSVQFWFDILSASDARSS